MIGASWDALYGHFRQFDRFATCDDDGAVAEGNSEAVLTLLDRSWNTLPRLAELVRQDSRFGSFVLRHVDDQMDHDTLRRVREHAKTACPRGLNETCAQISDAAERILPESATGDVETRAAIAKLGVEVACYIAPCVLRGDFDGDGVTDVAVLVSSKGKKRGIAIVPARGKPSLLGAGRKILTGGDNFDWMDHWELYPRGPVHQGFEEPAPPRLRGDALLVVHTESTSALIYWDGVEFRWYHQGD